MLHGDEQDIADYLHNLDTNAGHPRVELAVMDEERQRQKNDENEGERRLERHIISHRSLQHGDDALSHGTLTIVMTWLMAVLEMPSS